MRWTRPLTTAAAAAMAAVLAAGGGCEQAADDASGAERQQSQDVEGRSSVPGQAMDQAEDVKNQINERQRELSDMAESIGDDGSQ